MLVSATPLSVIPRSTLVMLYSLLLLLWSGGAGAATYTYVGNSYDQIVDGSPAGTFTESMSVSGSMTLTAELAPDLDNFDATGILAEYSFTNGRATYTSLDPIPNSIFEFNFSTDSAGQITGWHIQLWDSPLTVGVLTLNQGTPTNVEDLGVIGAGGNNHDQGKILNSPGVWTVVPEPNTALLLGFGLLGLGMRRRRRTRRGAAETPGGFPGVIFETC